MKNRNIVLRGYGASPGLAEAKVHVLRNSYEIVEIYDIDDPDAEIRRFRKAIEETKNDLIETKVMIEEKIGQDYREIFEAQILALDDVAVKAKTEDEIRKSCKNAEYVYSGVVNEIITNMEQIENDYLRDRIYDIRDILNRVLRKLSRKDEKTFSFEEPVVIAAMNLTPTDLVNWDKSKIAGIITEQGGITSHFAIMARALNIPSIVGIRNMMSELRKNDSVIADGYSGILIIDPDETSCKTYNRKKTEYEKINEELRQLTQQESVTLDQRQIELSANIELIEEIGEVGKNGAKGIGLLRTEFLFLSAGTVPSVENQTDMYKAAADGVYPDSVIVRTVDIGGDKPIFVSKKEDNPFLGFRGIRASLEFRDVFKSQLEAILRASTKKNLKIMLPLVSRVDELIQAKVILDEVKKDLLAKNVEYDTGIEIGIMVEVPSCALLADEFAKYADFFSIGTNDLTQYTLAVDRTNTKVSTLFDHFDPAVLKLIDMTVKAAHDNNIWAGVCGEMASDPVAAPILIGLGIDELSMTPLYVPEIKKIIREITYTECREIAYTVLSMRSSRHVREYMQDIIGKRFPNMMKYLEGR